MWCFPDKNTHLSLEENMIICFEDMETGKCLQEAPMGGKQYRLKMYAILLRILTIQLIFYVQYRLDIISVFFFFFSIYLYYHQTIES